MAQAVPQLEKFRYGGNFSRFLEQFEDYVALTGAMPRVDLLLLSLIDGITWDKIGRVRMEGPAGNDDPDHRAEVAAVKEFYREAYTRVEDRRSHQAKFTMLKQSEGESIESFGRRLEDLAEKAYPNDAVRTELQNPAFIRGLLDDRVKMQLIQLDELAYGDLVNRALRCEQAMEMMDQGRGKGVFGQEVEGAVNRTSERNQGGNGRKEEAYSAECYSCGEKGHLQRNCKYVKCYHCNGNHLRRDCPSYTGNIRMQRTTGRGARGTSAGTSGGRLENSRQGSGRNAAYMAKKCTYCDRDGHLYMDCWKRQAELWKELN